MNFSSTKKFMKEMKKEKNLKIQLQVIQIRNLLIFLRLNYQKQLKLQSTKDHLILKMSLKRKIMMRLKNNQMRQIIY